MVVAITAEGCGWGMDVSFSLGTLGDSQLFRADRLGTSGSSRAPARGDGGTRPDDRARSEKFPPPGRDQASYRTCACYTPFAYSASGLGDIHSYAPIRSFFGSVTVKVTPLRDG